MFNIKYIFQPNYERYDGVRPINIYLLRLFFVLMAAFAAPEGWISIINHQGPWDHIKAVAAIVLAVYPTLAVFGIFQPLKWLPLMVFMVSYKTTWLLIVAYPLWRAGTLASSPAAEMAGVFMMVPLAIVAVPWVYFFQTFVLKRKEVR